MVGLDRLNPRPRESADAPSGVGTFRIATSTDDVVGNVGIGMDVIGVEGTSFRLYYEGRFGDTVTDHAGGIKGSWNF